MADFSTCPNCGSNRDRDRATGCPGCGSRWFFFSYLYESEIQNIKTNIGWLFLSTIVIIIIYESIRLYYCLRIFSVLFC